MPLFQDSRGGRLMAALYRRPFVAETTAIRPAAAMCERESATDTVAKGHAFGTKAREALGIKVFGKIVRVEVVDVDRYRREVRRIYLGDRFINLEIVRDGFAWRYVRYDNAGEFTDAERESREHRRGL